MAVEQAPNPDNIIWDHIYYSDLSRFLRKLLSFLITIAFLVLCILYHYFFFLKAYALIVYIQSFKNVLIAKYPKVDCSKPMFDQIT